MNNQHTCMRPSNEERAHDARALERGVCSAVSGASLEYLLRRPRGELRRGWRGRGLGVGSSQEGRLAPPRPSRTRRAQRRTQQQPSTHSAAPVSAARVIPKTVPRW